MIDTSYPMEMDTPYSVIGQNSVKGGFQPERLAQGLEVGSIRRIQGLDTAYWGFLRVGTTLDIFQNIIFIPYFQYGVLVLSGYSVLILFPFVVFGECRHGYAVSSLMDKAYRRIGL
ncbi:hypothetical protein Tco_0471263 [Tanacetum coccineum]